ncbi:hypothetical protein [Aquibacillus saliphilus]|uniref:hypothetical protein n=1 Tax=Aquibacillus saliphilus TaxID=1909422 RepID=UPI001CF01A64|nr:hypothetical protein [Aquibacillus saliphilus]
MKKVIYKNEYSELVAEADGGVVTLTQYLDSVQDGVISIYYDEVKELNEFITSVIKIESKTD